MKRLVTILVLGAAACADESPSTPDNALELTMRATIPAGTEVEYCKFVEIPDAWVTKDTVEFTAGSHHVLVYQTSYTTIPTAKENGTVVDTSGVFDCSDGATSWKVTKLIGGSQNRDGAAILSFPDGIALHVGGIAMINVHYVNGSDAPLDTDVKIRFETIAAEDVVQEGDILFLYNPLISVPAGGTARAHMRCPVYADITIANAQSHMHARGTGYEARVDTNAPFYTNSEWESVPVKDYENLTVKAGSTLDYYCDYRNTTGRGIYQGPRSTDEMCMLIGSYYPADPRTANCLDPSGKVPGGDWVGGGSATCQATLGCLQNAGGALPAITDCMLAAKPEVAAPASAALRCFMTATNPLADCGPQIQACSAR
ncbi:MAG: hypothetical protein H0T89_06275 [Deltaproteobacteria bacterium]|nr:hypothetical protein [Deltaproteobacteria bacterium]MDQ3296646.1 hypothetical protein [Myxococcota bacterium]